MEEQLTLEEILREGMISSSDHHHGVISSFDHHQGDDFQFGEMLNRHPLCFLSNLPGHCRLIKFRQSGDLYFKARKD